MSASIPYPVGPDAPKRSRRRLVAVRLVRECTFLGPAGYPHPGAQIRSAAKVFALMRPYADRELGEAFWILPLDNQSRMCTPGPVVISRGILNSSLVHPREVFHAAIEALAAGLILVHNHPSGDPTPSAEDRAVTRQLVAVGKLHEIPIYDHVIVGRGRYLSFAEAGLM
jgi:DNA repair protein RadC